MAKKKTRYKWKHTPHRTHRMGRSKCEVLAPCGTPRFYSVRSCTKCGNSQSQHAAGTFCDTELLRPCKGKIHG